MSEAKSAVAASVFRPWFRFLVPTGSTDPVAIVSELRDNVGSLRRTKAAFTLSDVMEDPHVRSVDPRMLTLVGAWRMPDYYPGATDSDHTYRYINPGYIHAHKYPDVFVECECGAKMVTQHSQTENRVENEHDHAEDCKRSWRLHARAELIERREEAVRNIIGLGLSVRRFSRRFGMDPDGYDHSIGSLTEAQRMPSDRMRRDAAERRTNTECALLAAGYSTEEVGRVWGVSASTIRERVALRTEHDVSELRSMVFNP